jgi:hypothetical protein
MSANKVTGPMPGGGGGKPHGCTCSGDGGPASGGVGTDGACADALWMVVPQKTSERAQTALANFIIMTVSSDAFVVCFKRSEHLPKTWHQHGHEKLSMQNGAKVERSFFDPRNRGPS